MEISPDDGEALNDELRPDYDFRALRGVVRGKYATQYRERLRFLSEDDVLAEGLRLLRASELLRTEVRSGFEQLDAGTGIPAERVYSRAIERISQVADGTQP